jgi:glycosyltransferase involved in cell wall biosynthesis
MAMTNPAISVAMSVYNGEQFLALAIESILAQTFTDFEFLILDDGSKDGSAAIIDAYAAQDSRIRAIHRENKGLIVSLNQLIEESRAPLIARMDCDDISLPERFAKQMAFLKANPEYGVVGSWTADIDENGEPYPIEGDDHATTHEGFLAAIAKGPLLCHPSVLMRREAVLAVGGYHAAFQHCEDFDLWLRLAGVTRLCSLPERLVKYRHWTNQVSNRHAYVQQIGAAVSYHAWLERQAGRPDPTADADVLPPVDQMDKLFGRPGMAKAIRAFVAPSMLYAETALKADGYYLIRQFIREGGKADGLWRTTMRLLRIGEPLRAIGLGLALIGR